MIWLLMIPAIVILTFRSLIISDFPGMDGEDRGFLSWVVVLFLGCLISGVISLVPLGLGSWIGSIPARQGIEDHRYPLVALREKDGVSGRFFLGSGLIESQEYYFWYRRNPDASVSGGKTLRQPCVTIYEDNAVPTMVTFKTAYTDKNTENWLRFVGLDMRESEHWCEVFHIPPGSIAAGYSL